MAYCRHCHQEYPEETRQCPACGRRLLAQRPAWRPYDPQEPLEVVRTAQGELEAELLKGQLELEGIPVVVVRESAVLGLTIDGLGAQRLMVPRSLATAAREILAALEDSAGIPD